MVYLDTSVLLALTISRHEVHQQAITAVRGYLKNNSKIGTATHTLGEAYRHLTRNVPPFEVTPGQASKLLSESLTKSITIVDLNKSDYDAALVRCANLELSGPIVYDALHLQAAIKFGANKLCTDNTKDFERLLMPDDRIEIVGVR